MHAALESTATGTQRRRVPVSIRSRLLLLVLLVLLPALAGTLWVIAQAYRSDRDALQRNLRDTTRAVSMVVDRELSQRAAIARVLALSPLLDAAPDVSPEQLAAFEQQARHAMDGVGGWVELNSATGKLLSTRGALGALPQAQGAPGANRLSDTPAIGPLLPLLPPLHPSTAPGAAVPSLEPPPAHSAVLQPVLRNGRAVLNVAVTLLPAELQAIVDRQRVPADWVATVIDARGVVVARHPGGAAYTGRPVPPDFKAVLAASQDGPFEAVSLDGVPVIGHFTTSTQGWTYVTAVPRQQLAGFVPQAVLPVVAGALLLLAGAVAAALRVARSIAGPVDMLKHSAARMQGGLPVEYRPTGIAECDDVAAALGEAAAAAQAARADLERQVAAAVERTRKAEQRASHSQRVEALGQLTGGVAHDFNNLLGVIGNSAHLIQRHAHAPELLAPVAATLRAVETGSRLTHHLLRFAGRQPVRPRPVNLAHYLPGVEELLQSVLGPRIRVAVAVLPGTQPVTVDTTELELALINLAFNARDAMPAGGQLWLRASDAAPEDTAGLPPGPYVLVTVSDDGQGVADRVLHRVFEPFFTTKPAGHGTGLGLSQVHGFCTQAGGAARLASTPGLGTTVSLVLPASKPAEQLESSALPEPEDSGLVDANVLLVEDNQELAAVTVALLESHGCRVQHAQHPAQALKLLASDTSVDVVLSDVVMPGAMDGLALARELRVRRPDLPVVLISGYSAVLDRAGDFTVLHKPCAPSELLAALRQAVERSTSRA